MLNEQELMLQAAVDEWARDNVLKRGYSELEARGKIPAEFLRALTDMGLMGMSFPERYGGLEASATAASVVAERLAFAWPSLHLVWSANGSLAGYPISRFGEEWQKKKYLPRLASGEILGCYALTEPDAGSDAANIKMSARFNKEDFSWTLNGTKTFITNALDASLVIVFARVSQMDADLYRNSMLETSPKREPRVLDPEHPAWRKRHSGITAFVVGGLEPGLKVHPSRGRIGVRKIEKWGLLSSPFAEVAFEDVNVGGAATLDKVGNGFGVAMETLNNGRINIAAQATGIARRAIYEAQNYASRRELFDTTLLKIPLQARRFARLRKKIERAWELTLRASRAKDSKPDYRVEASEAKLYASEAAVDCATFNCRIHGGLGYTKECTAMSILHDALATITYEGTSDIQRLTIKRGHKS